MSSLPPLEFASASHWGALAVLFVLGLCVVELGQSDKRAIRSATGIWLGITCILSMILDQVALLADDPHVSRQEMLPLHFCSIMQFMCVIALGVRSRRIRAITYYGVLCASLQGLITPALAHDYPSPSYFAFFLSHGITVIIALYLPLALKWKPARWDMLWAIGFGIVFLIGVHMINLCLDTNYGFTVSTPPGGSVLDFLGPWPWYMVVMQAPLLGLCMLLTLPFRHYPKGRKGHGITE